MLIRKKSLADLRGDNSEKKDGDELACVRCRRKTRRLKNQVPWHSEEKQYCRGRKGHDQTN